MGPCHSSSKLKLKKGISSTTSKPIVSFEDIQNGQHPRLTVAPSIQINVMALNEHDPDRVESNPKEDSKRSSLVEQENGENECLEYEKTIEMLPLKKKIELIKSEIILEENDTNKEHRFLDLTFSYKKLFDFRLRIRQEIQISQWQWELVNIIMAPSNGSSEDESGIIYKVLDKKSGMRANLQIIEFVGEDDPEIAKTAYEIYLHELIKKALEKVLSEDSQKERKKKDSLEMREFLNDPPFIQVIDYYVYQEGFQYTLKPKKWLHVVWEEWDSSLSQIIETRRMNKSYYQEEELVYIGKCMIYGLAVMKMAKIAHRNLNPKSVYYVNSTKKYKIGNFRLAKLKNVYKLALDKEERTNSSPPKHMNANRNDRRTEFFSNKYSVKTLNLNENKATTKRFEQSVVGTPYYMNITLKTGFLLKKETVRMLESLYNNDLFSFALTMLEVENLAKYEDFETLVKKNFGRETVSTIFKTSILFKILNMEVKLDNIFVGNVPIEVKCLLKGTMRSIEGIESPLREDGGMSRRGIKSKQRMFYGTSVKARDSVENGNKNGVKTNDVYLDFLKQRPGNILSKLRKIKHLKSDDNDFLINRLTEILEMEGGLAKQNIFSRFYVNIGDYTKALEEFLSCREYLENNREESNNNTEWEFYMAEKTIEIARLHMILGKYGTALSFLDEVKKLVSSSENSSRVLVLKKSMSIIRMLIYKNKGDLKLGIQVAKKLIYFLEKNERGSDDLPLVKEFVAEIYFLLDENTDAMNNIQTALGKYRELEVFQVGSLQLADALIFASQIYKTLLEIENSQAFLTEARVIYFNKYGERHPVIGYILLQLSQIYRDKANYSKAIDEGKKALNIMQYYYCEEDDNVMEAVKNLSLIYKEAEEIKKSINLLEKSIKSIDRGKLSENSLCLLAENMYNLGLFYMEVNDFPNSYTYFSESLAVYNSILSEDDFIFNDILQKLTMINYEMTKTKKPPLEKSLYADERKTVRNSTLERNSERMSAYSEGSLVNSYINLADILMMKGEFERSLKIYLSALKIKKESNYNDSKFNDILMKIGFIYLVAGRYDESLKYFQDCLKFICDISADQFSEDILRLNLVISHLYAILEQLPLAQEYSEKASTIMAHLKNFSKIIIKDQLLIDRARNYVSLDFSKEKTLDKNEVLNDLIEILQTAFHFEDSNCNKLDPGQKMSLISSINQTQGELSNRKNMETSAQNLSKDEQPNIKKMASLMMYDSLSINRNFGISLKSPQSFSSSHRATSLVRSGSTPRFRGDSLIFKKKSFGFLAQVEKNTEFLFPEKTGSGINNSNDVAVRVHSLIRHEKSLNSIFTTPKSQEKKKRSLEPMEQLLEEDRNEEA